MKVTLAEAQLLQGEKGFSAYACLDTTGTREIYDILRPRLDTDQERTYKWSLAQLSPSITMTRRGCRIDPFALQDAKKQLEKDLVVAEKAIQLLPLVREKWDGVQLNRADCPKNKPRKNGTPGKHLWPRRKPGESPLKESEKFCTHCGASRVAPKPFEASSSTQCRHLLYDLLRVPVHHGKDGTVTTDDDALQRISHAGVAWVDTAPKKSGTGPGWRRVRRPLPGLSDLCEAILTMRDISKQLGFLNCKLSDRGRFHASFNVAAAWTGRWSSSKDPFQRGGNFQNIGEQHRHIFIPDPGRKIGYADLKTAESLQVAYLAGDENYIEAHKGDVHTWVARELWPDLAWTGDLKQDKHLASNSYPEWDNVPGHDFRFQSKRVQHGTNFGLSPQGIAMIAKIPFEQAKQAQRRYFTAFPMIQEYQRYIAERVKGAFPLYNALRRQVRLFGRPWDDHTRKQGLAFSPQSGVADVLDTGLWRVWKECDPWLIELLAQVHDAILFQYSVSKEQAAVEALRRLMAVDVPITDFQGVERVCTIPVEIAIGDNWGKANTDPKKGRLNPKGLVEIK